MENLKNFLDGQEIISIATQKDAEIWSASAYYVTDDKLNMYFISQKGSKHSQMLLKNSNLAFSVAWCDPKSHKNRKGVQGTGTCRIAKTPAELSTALKLMLKTFPDLKSILTVKWIMENAWGSKIWVIKPKYMKYWDDEIYGDDESEEFNI